MEFTVMTFNLRNSRADDGAHSWPFRLQRVADTIRANEACVIGIQEGYLDMLEELNPLLPEYGWIGEGRDGGTQGEHCAIFYLKREVAVLEKGQFWLSETPDREGSVSWDSSLPRICTWARFRFIGQPEREVTVFNTHLDHIGQQAREQGVRLIRQAIEEVGKDRPAVLLGDFNSTPDNLVVRFCGGQAEIDGVRAAMTDAFSAMSEAPGRTFHDFHGGREGEPIDYIFVNERLRVTNVLVDRRKMDGGYPSDHYPVVARIGIEACPAIA